MKLVAHIPNLLTLSRILLLPLIVYLYLSHRYLAAVVIFAVACVTDYLDGRLARRLGLESPLGAILDPLSDKLFTLAFFTLLMAHGACPPWFLALLLAIALLQAIGFLILLVVRSPRYPVRPLGIGKWNIALQFTWIGVLFADVFLRHQFPRNFHYSELFHVAGYAALAVIQVVVFFRYFFRFRSQLVPDLGSLSPSSPH